MFIIHKKQQKTENPLLFPFISIILTRQKALPTVEITLFGIFCALLCLRPQYVVFTQGGHFMRPLICSLSPVSLSRERFLPSLFLLTGSLFGAFAAGRYLLCCAGEGPFVLPGLDAVPVSRLFLLSTLWVFLLFTAGFSRSDYFLYCLLFFRGFLSGYVFWLAGFVFRQRGSSFPLLLLLLCNLLPLPAFFLTADYFLHPDRLAPRFPLPFLILLHCGWIGLVLLLRALLF